MGGAGTLGPPSTVGGASRRASPLPTKPEKQLYQWPSQTGPRSRIRANKRSRRPGVSSVTPRAAVGGPGRARHQRGFSRAGDRCGGLPPRKGSPLGPRCGGSRLPMAGGERRARMFQCWFPQISHPIFSPWCSLAQAVGGQTTGPSRGHPKPGEAAQGPTHHHPSCRGPPPPPDRSPDLHSLILNLRYR